MTDRDTFAAAALTGLLARGLLQSNLLAADAYKVADAMLRERGQTNLDAAPAAIVPEPEPEPAARRLPAGGTGGTDHGASPEARASVDSVVPQPTTHGDSDRTDKAAPRPSEGTGDTPDSPKPIKGGVSDRSKPITGPDPDSRVWETHTPATHATHGECSVPREGAEPEAWAVCTPGDGDWSPCFFHEPHAQRCASAIFGSKNIVPLYRKHTLTDAEAETLRELRDEAAQYADEIGLCASEVRGRQRIIDGLLVRLGGER